MNSTSYLGSRLAPICIVLARFLTSMSMALASSCALKMLDVGGIPGLSGVVGNPMLSSLRSAAASLMPKGMNKATRGGLMGAN
jgi:hypothetical protein